jgi:CHAT domain-containing protein
LGEQGQLLSLDLLLPAANSLENWTLPIVSLPQLLTGGNVSSATGVAVNSQGQVVLTGSANSTVENGDVVIKEVSAQTATIAADRNLTLVNSQLTTTGNLDLFAEIVQGRDSVAAPLIVSAGGNLTIEGDRQIDIFALNHPSSGLFAGGDLKLRSASTVNGDAHYYAGGNFGIETLNGDRGNLFSPDDPVILANGDVSLGDYTGASLHILAGGSITLGNIEITGTDTTTNTISVNNPDAFLASFSNITLSNTIDTVSINGATTPTLDLRAGIDWAQTTLGSLPGNAVIGTISPAPNFVSTPSSANITTGNIRISAPNGNVFLTNQQFQNTALTGGTIATGAIDTSSNIGNGGSVTIDSKRAVNVDFGQINTQGAADFNNGNTRVLVTFSQDDLLAGGIDSDVFFLDLTTARQGTVLASNDDGSSALVDLGFEFPFFGTTYTSVYVNNNGNVTFNAPLAQYTATDIATSAFPFIGAYFTDVDTRNTAVRPPGTNQTYYTTRTIPGTSTQQFVVTYDQVGYFNQKNDLTATLQIAFDQLGRIGFAYNDIQFETGDASGGVNGFGGTPAAIGINTGLGLLSTNTPNSGTASIVYNQSLTDGVSNNIDFTHIFLSSNTSAPVLPPTATPIPEPIPTPIAIPTPEPILIPTPTPTLIPIPTSPEPIPTPIPIPTPDSQITPLLELVTATQQQAPPNLQTPLVNNWGGNSNVLINAIAPEAQFTNEFENYLGLSNSASLISSEDERQIARRIEQQTGAKPAFIYVNLVPPEVNSATSQKSTKVLEKDTDELEIILVMPQGEPIRKRISGATRKQVLAMATKFRNEVTNTRRLRSTSYLSPAKQMYSWIIAPIKSDLEAQHITNLVFLLNAGLRSMPVAAMHDGKGFLIEKYSVGLMPSISLTDTRYVNIKNSQVLALGISESTQGQSPLPAVSFELSTLVNYLWTGSKYINQSFTRQNLKNLRRQQPFSIVHMATHADISSGAIDNSYIQLWNDRLRLNQIRQLELNNPQVEMLVLSACRTALGNEDAELGFAGLAVNAGVKTTVASLWFVNDTATAAFMTRFYRYLSTASIKADAMRQAQVAMAKGQISIKDGHLRGLGLVAGVPFPQATVDLPDQNFSHPYFWSGFTMVGNPW